ncbi:MAG: hypothetical protein DSZ32_02675, partial [Gammaproteobacteria bacterium]
AKAGVDRSQSPVTIHGFIIICLMIAQHLAQRHEEFAIFRFQRSAATEPSSPVVPVCNRIPGGDAGHVI